MNALKIIENSNLEKKIKSEVNDEKIIYTLFLLNIIKNIFEDNSLENYKRRKRSIKYEYILKLLSYRYKCICTSNSAAPAKPVPFSLKISYVPHKIVFDSKFINIYDFDLNKVINLICKNFNYLNFYGCILSTSASGTSFDVCIRGSEYDYHSSSLIINTDNSQTLGQKQMYKDLILNFGKNGMYLKLLVNKIKWSDNKIVSEYLPSKNLIYKICKNIPTYIKRIVFEYLQPSKTVNFGTIYNEFKFPVRITYFSKVI